MFDLKKGFMARGRHAAEQIVAKLREAEVLQGKGMPLEEVLRQVANA